MATRKNRYRGNHIRCPYNGTISEKLAFYARPGENGCINFSGKKNGDGYGCVHYKGRVHGAHRLALMEKLGRDIAPDLCALHSCHNPACINPDHLREGTHKENMHDMFNANRRKHAWGDRSGVTVISEADTIAVYLDTRKRGLVLKQYGISPSVYHQIKRGKRRIIQDTSSLPPVGPPRWKWPDSAKRRKPKAPA